MLKWSAALATGVPELDVQHQSLIKAVGDYRLALDEGRGERVYEVLLRFMDEYARAHFGLEQQCMHRYRCPAAEANADAHEHFLRVLSGFRESFARFGYRDDDARGLTIFAEGWLLSHIAGIDTRLRGCVEAAGTAAEP